jgi:hypothetical protein
MACLTLLFPSVPILATLDPTLCGLMDTCGALNTGYLKFHLWVADVRTA